MKAKSKRSIKKPKRNRFALSRRKIIVALSVIVLLVSFAVIYGLFFHKDKKQPVITSTSSQGTGGLSVSNQPTGNITFGDQAPQALDILKQINNTRVANNLPPVSENNLLDQSAVSKANDMITRNYWAHNAPDGTEPWVFIKQAGYRYQYAGENLWYGRNNTTVTDWLNSSTHKAVMLDAHYTEIGISVQKAANYNGQQNVYVVVTHYASPYAGSASSYTPTTSTTKSSGTGYQYQLPDYNPTPMPDFSNRTTPTYQTPTPKQCGSNTDSSYYADCMGQ